MTVKLEKCKLENILELQEISIKTFDETFRADNEDKYIDEYLDKAFTLEKLEKEILNENSFFHLCRKDNKVIGYLKLNILSAQSEIMDSDYLEVERIYILREYKNNGIGSLLMDHAISFAKEKNKNKIWLGVWEHNYNAIRFYEKYDFKVVDSHSFFMGEDEQTDYIMVKELN